MDRKAVIKHNLAHFLYAILTKRTEALYSSLYAFKPKHVSHPFLESAMKIAQLVDFPEAIALLQMINGRSLLTPKLIAKECLPKLSPTWIAECVMPDVCIETFTQAQLVTLNANFLCLNTALRTSLLLYVLSSNKDLPLPDERVFDILLIKVIGNQEHDRRKRISMAITGVYELLQRTTLSDPEWTYHFQEIIQNNQHQDQAANLLHYLMDNTLLTANIVSDLPWQTWLETTFDEGLLDIATYQRLHYLGFSLIDHLNQMPANNDVAIKDLLRRLRKIGFNIHSPQLEKLQASVFKRCENVLDASQAKFLECYRHVLEVIINPQLRVLPLIYQNREFNSVLKSCKEMNLITESQNTVLAKNDYYTNDSNLLFYLTNQMNGISPRLLSNLSLCDIQALRCTSSRFQAALSDIPHLQALSSLMTSHKLWLQNYLEFIAKVNGYWGKLLWKKVGIILLGVLLGALCIAGILSLTAYVNQISFLENILSFDDGTGPAVSSILWVAAMVIGGFLAWLLEFIVTRPHHFRNGGTTLSLFYTMIPILENSQVATEAFDVKLQSLLALVSPLTSIFEELMILNPLLRPAFENCYDDFTAVDLSPRRINLRYANNPNTFVLDSRWTQDLRNDLQRVDRNAMRTHITNLHFDLRQQAINWDDQLNAHGTIGRSLLELCPTIFRQKPKLIVGFSESINTVNEFVETLPESESDSDAPLLRRG